MPILRTILLTVMALAGADANAKPAAPKGAPPAALSVTLNQGEVARWPGIAAKSCVPGATSRLWMPPALPVLSRPSLRAE